MKSRDSGLYILAVALVGAIVLLGVGFASGFIAGIHGGVVFPLLLLAVIAAVVLASVYLVFAGWRMASGWLDRVVVSLPLSLLLVVIASLAYGIATV